MWGKIFYVMQTKEIFKKFSLYVKTNVDDIPLANEYVLWIDNMGTSARMSVSIQQSANFLLKLHQAIQKASEGKNGLRVYPIMDAAYVTSKTQDEMLSFINSLFTILTLEFIRQEDPEHQFLVRGSLSYGPVYHAQDLIPWMTRDESGDESGDESYWEKVLLGIPIIQAYDSEGKAPPMGVFVHETARAFSPENEKLLPYVWDVWQVPQLLKGNNLGIDGNELWFELNKSLILYFDWCKQHSLRIGYSEDAIERHKKLWEAYYKRYQDIYANKK